MTITARRRRGADPEAPSDAAASRPARSIRTRLTLLLAVPTIALILLAAVGVVSQASVVRGVDQTVQGVRLVLSTQDVIHELDRERGLSTGVVAGEARFRSQLDQQRAQVDRVRAAWQQQLGASDAGRAIADAPGRLAGLSAIRQRVDARAVDASQTIGSFTTLIADLGNAANRQLVGPGDAELQRGLTALRAISDAKEYTGQERATGTGAFVANSFQASSYQSLSRADAGRVAGFQAFRAVASPVEAASLDAAVASPAGTAAARLWARGLDSPSAPTLGVNAPGWHDEMTTFIDELHSTQQAAGGGIIARADALGSSARTLLVLCAVLALLVLVTVIALITAAIRAIVRPVTRLTDHADDIARRWLPQAVAGVQAPEGGDVLEPPRPEHPVTRRGRAAREIVELGSALDDVARTALRLASEQSRSRHNTATSLAALGRRNQELVRRQLDLIDDLERDESDPEVLGDLFTLDHLATRMRRNAESVLVMVGERTTRRWSSSVPIQDVLRAAISEVEDYPRVELKALERGGVTGAVAADVTHIAAELLENALAFSPPDRPVEMHGKKIDGAYLIAIVDHGTGMTDDELGLANARLRASESFPVAPTRFLGHYVVGTLARRLGVDVTLQRSPLTGLTARISLPDAVLVVPGTPEAQPPERAETLETAEAPETARAPDESPESPESPETAEASQSESAETAPAATVGKVRSPQTTRHGLVKRVRGAAAPETARGREPVPAPDTAERPPDEVRSMLSTFRRGVEGASATPPGPAADAPSSEATAGLSDSGADEGSALVGEER